MAMVSSFMAEAAVNGSSSSSSVGGVVVGPQYCAPYPVELAIERNVFIPTKLFVVTDVNDNLLFKVKSVPFSLHARMIILDAAGNVILTLRRKLWSFHLGWKVFRGESSNPNDMIFTTKMSPYEWHKMSYATQNLNVYLANNAGPEFCDFKVDGSNFERSCVVYAGESNSTIVAQMENKVTARRFFLIHGWDKFMVTVYPNIDSAFIVALIVMLDANKSSNNDMHT